MICSWLSMCNRLYALALALVARLSSTRCSSSYSISLLLLLVVLLLVDLLSNIHLVVGLLIVLLLGALSIVVDVDSLLLLPCLGALPFLTNIHTRHGRYHDCKCLSTFPNILCCFLCSDFFFLGVDDFDHLCAICLQQR